MPVCPVCKRAFDERLQVFVPPRTEAFDTIECALRATRGSGTSEADLPTEPPVLHIEMRPPPALLDAGPLLGDRPPRRRPAAAAGLAAGLAKVVGAPGAAAAGLSLLGAGTAASLYLGWLSFGGESQTLSSRVAAPRLPSQPVPRRVTEPRPVVEAPRLKPKPEVSRPKPPATRVRPRPKPSRAARLASPELSNAEAESKGFSPSPHSGRTPSGNARRATLSPPSTPKPKSSGPSAAPRSAPAPPPPAPPAPSPSKPKPSKPGKGGGNGAPSPSKAPSPPPLLPYGQPPDPSAQPASSTQNPSRPGNGRGDKNHRHTGPPGQTRKPNG
jgi:hypothetical protein